MKFEIFSVVTEPVAQSYIEYAYMRRWLADRAIEHHFEWENTGNYLPQYIVISDIDAAIFKLVFCMPPV